MARPLTTASSTGVGVGMFSIVIPVAIWPGEAELTAPLFCSGPYREPVVVSDTDHDSEGTSVDYTLYCVTDEGFFLPFLVPMSVYVAIITAGLPCRMPEPSQHRAPAGPQTSNHLSTDRTSPTPSDQAWPTNPGGSEAVPWRPTPRHGGR